MVKPQKKQSKFCSPLAKYIAEPTHFQVGGTGNIYRARCIDTKEFVAIKVISFISPNYKRVFDNEVKLLTEMKNSFFTVKMKESFIFDNRGYIVLNLLHNDLYVRAESFNTIAEVKNVFQQICWGVCELHEQNIAHLDLKPENILLTSDDKVKICDFGSSFKCNTFNSICYTFTGSDFYLAPEIYGHKNGFDAKKADIWSLGILLFVILCDCFPFEGNTRDQLLKSYFTHKISLNELKHVCPNDKACFDLISKLLIHDPNSRPSIDEIMKHEWFLSIEEEIAPMQLA